MGYRELNSALLSPNGSSSDPLQMLCPWSLSKPVAGKCCALCSLILSFSTEYLKEKLDAYMSRFPKVKILHLKERHGLIRARLAGAQVAKGKEKPGHTPARAPLGCPR